MSSGSLTYTLVVRHPETGEATPLVAGSKVPDWAADLVHPDDLDGAGSDVKPSKKAAAKRPSK